MDHDTVGSRQGEPAFVQTHDGLRLAAWHHSAQGPTLRARLVLVHGYAEHGGRYAWLVASLGAAGYECAVFDLRGHGRSGGPRGHVGRFAEYLDDLDRVVQWAAAQARAGGPRPVRRFVVGHSLGGLIALEHVRLRPGAFDGLAASSPFLAPTFTTPSPARNPRTSTRR